MSRMSTGQGGAAAVVILLCVCRAVDVAAQATIIDPPTVSTGFSPSTINVNGTSVLTFTIHNPNTSTTLVNVGFNDSLPLGVQAATPWGVSGVPCGGSLLGGAGSGALNLTGGTIAANGTCTFSVNVVGTSWGAWDNSVRVWSDNAVLSAPSKATLRVIGPPGFYKEFFSGVTTATTANVNDTLRLFFHISNLVPGTTLTGVGFTDPLPPGLVVANPSNLSVWCGSGTVTAVPGSSTISLSGVTITAPANTWAECGLGVDVTVTGHGTKNNVTTPVTSVEAGTGVAAHATLIVPCGPLAIQPAQLSSAALNYSYSQPLTTSGALGAVTYSLQSGALPSGLSFNGAGLTGTPTSLGAFEFTVLAQDTGGCSASRGYAVNVNRATPVATGAGPDAAGDPRVKTFAPEVGPASLDTGFDAFDPLFTGGVRVALGDVNGDGIADIITAQGPGGGPNIRVYNGAGHALLSEFAAETAGYNLGLFVAAGDVDRDGFADIIVGAGGGEPRVRVFSGASGAVLYSFLAYAPSFAGGVRVGAGDVNGDGYADIITGAGPGGGPHVEVFSGYDSSVLASFFAYAPTFAGGLWVASGDVDGDGKADVVTGADAGGGPHVCVYSGATGAAIRSFFAYDPSFAGGVRVAAADVNHDGHADIVTAPGAGGGPHVRVWDGLTGAELTGLFAYGASFAGGVFVAAPAPLNRVFVDVPIVNGFVPSTFTIAGWALQEGSTSDSGVDAIHIYAYPVIFGGIVNAPRFLGAAVTGDARGDIAAYFGGRFLNAGFHLVAAGVPVGDYILVVYVHSSVTHTFNQRRIVPIFVR